MKKFSALIILSVLAVIVPSLSWAGGLYLYEIGPQEVGLASSGWAARAQDASTVFTNPAGMTRLNQSELQVGLQPEKSRFPLRIVLHLLPLGRTPDSGDTVN